MWHQREKKLSSKRKGNMSCIELEVVVALKEPPYGTLEDLDDLEILDFLTEVRKIFNFASAPSVINR